MNDTPRTDALQIAYRKAWGERNEKAAVDALLESHAELERELAAAHKSDAESVAMYHRARERADRERALADRLANAIKQSVSAFVDNLPCEESCQCRGRIAAKVNDEAFAAWKAARDEASH